jgi:phosphate transport system substrate-binding protein
LATVIGLAIALAACGSSGGGSSSNTLAGAGSSFQKAYEEALIAGFQGSNADVTVTYNPVGSGSGKSSLQTEDVDFAGTDSLPNDDELSAYQGGDLLYFPLASAPITVSYNLPDVKTLKLDGETLAKIFAVKITKWNDPAIAALNPGVDLPSTAITVAHRADGSGTTSNFTKYLDAVAPTDWTLGSGDTVEWPSNTQAGTGNPGVAQIVQQNEGAVGYVDLADATAAELQTAEIKNKDGKYVAPTVEGSEAAVENATLDADLSFDPINTSGAAAYPITSPTWIIAYANQSSNEVGTNLKNYLTYIYGAGQGLAKDAGYAPLPPSYVQKAQAQVGKLQIPSS